MIKLPLLKLGGVELMTGMCQWKNINCLKEIDLTKEKVELHYM